MTSIEHPPKVLFHVQHLLGIGHQVRAAAIARAMAAAGLEVHLVQGGAVEDQGPAQAGLQTHVLPAVRSADSRFSDLIDNRGRPIDDAWRANRRDRLMTLFRQIDPDIVLIEGFPFARRQFRFELAPLIAAAQGRVPVAVSVRDILVEKKKPGRAEEIVDIVARGVDRVFVHGDPEFVPLQRSFPLAERITQKIAYTGYVVPSPTENGADTPDGGDEIIVSAGGGAVGGALLQAALAAAGHPDLQGRRWRLLVGRNLPDADRAALSNAPPGVVVEPARPDFRVLLSRAALSISQAGYNTMMDLAATGCPAVLVPFAGVGETEQPLRAGLAEDRGWVSVVPESDLTPARLAAAIAAQLALPRPGVWPLDRGGAARTAAFVKTMALEGRVGR